MRKLEPFPPARKGTSENTQKGVDKGGRGSKPLQKSKRLWLLLIAMGILLCTAILIWVLRPKQITPTPDPKRKIGWEEVILARVEGYETKRLDSLLMGDIEVEALFDSIVRRETRIYWQVTEEEDWQGPSTFGAPAFAYNQLAAVHGYGKREGATDLHVAILDYRLGPRWHELESLTLQLEIQ
jgi:hypothetical protein